jgi:hypothetical protein
LLSTFCSTRLLFIVTATIQAVSASERDNKRFAREQSVFDEPSRIAVLCAPPEQHLSSAFHHVQLDLIFKSAARPL